MLRGQNCFKDTYSQTQEASNGFMKVPHESTTIAFEEFQRARHPKVLIGSSQLEFGSTLFLGQKETLHFSHLIVKRHFMSRLGQTSVDFYIKNTHFKIFIFFARINIKDFFGKIIITKMLKIM